MPVRQTNPMQDGRGLRFSPGEPGAPGTEGQILYEEPDHVEEKSNSAELISEQNDLKVPERDPRHIFDIIFKKKPLGIIFTSAENGKCAYVTQLKGKKNKAIRKGKLPVNSKLLKVNGETIELEYMDKITRLIVKELEKLPLTLTFCHPDGLRPDEKPDPKPKMDYTAKK